MAFTHRQYNSEDRGDCIRVFDSNVPKFFRDHERPDFVSFLDSEECPYFVIEFENAIIGCGGYGIREGSDQADMCWGMVAAEYHGKHAGEYLLLARLYEIVTATCATSVRLGTSQYTDGFFQKYGFAIQSIKPDGIDTGLDEVEMRLQLTDDAKQLITARWNERGA